jgi:hypothetical protein
VYVCGWRYTGPAYEPLLLPELRRVLRWRVDEDEWCVVLEVAGFSATLASACGWAAGCGTGTWFSSTGLAAATGCAGCTIMLSSQVSWGCVWAVFASRPQAAAPTSVDIITATLRTRIGLLLLWDSGADRFARPALPPVMRTFAGPPRLTPLLLTYLL